VFRARRDQHLERGRAALRTLFLLLLLAAAGAAGGYAWLKHAFEAPGPAAQVSRVEVAPGTSLRTVLNHLEAAGTLRNARAVEGYVRLTGLHVRVEAGLYEIPAHASAAQVLALFNEGKVVLEQLTVVEGATFGDFLEILAAHPYIAHTLRGKSAAAVMVAIGHPGVPPEGQFFPDTYRFAANTSDAAILGLAYEALQRELAAAWQARAPGLPFTTPYQALILASMVEKEAALKSERAPIAGVFVNRLKKGMRLQSDPTVIYGLGEQYDGSIHTRDLQTDTPYNTYTRDGLPPTPIALPGRESLWAAVQPEDTGALYFVATGAGDGAHHFSRTLEEHNQAVQAYLARLRGPAHAPTARPQVTRTPGAPHP
jgi:UPF0755 protein